MRGAREAHGGAGEPGMGASRPVGVLIVDDQATFRKALRDLVAATPELALAGEAESGEAAIDAVEALAPRMIIMDKRMPGMGGVEATRRIVARHPEMVVPQLSARTLRALEGIQGALTRGSQMITS